jgi:hypothetical protein
MFLESSAQHPLPSRPVPSREATLIEALLMMMAVVPVLISAYVSLVTGEGHWFQRSGALMVLFSIGVEYHRKHVIRCLETNEVSPLGSPHPMAKVILRFWQSIPYVCYMAIVVGTLIWAYGDLVVM